MAIMNTTNTTLEIIRALSNGVDPYTGEAFEASSLYRHPDTIEALGFCLRTLESKDKGIARKPRKKPQNPENYGVPWTNEEDAQLRAAFQMDTTIRQLAKDHKRTTGSIVGRLGLYGLVEPQYGKKNFSHK